MEEGVFDKMDILSYQDLTARRSMIVFSVDIVGVISWLSQVLGSAVGGVSCVVAPRVGKKDACNVCHLKNAWRRLNAASVCSERCRSKGR